MEGIYTFSISVLYPEKGKQNVTRTFLLKRNQLTMGFVDKYNFSLKAKMLKDHNQVLV